MEPMCGRRNAAALHRWWAIAVLVNVLAGLRLHFVAPSRGARRAKPIRIVAFGDSLSAGYGAAARASRSRRSCRRS